MCSCSSQDGFNPETRTFGSSRDISNHIIRRIWQPKGCWLTVRLFPIEAVIRYDVYWYFCLSSKVTKEAVICFHAILPHHVAMPGSVKGDVVFDTELVRSMNDNTALE